MAISEGSSDGMGTPRTKSAKSYKQVSSAEIPPRIRTLYKLFLVVGCANLVSLSIGYTFGFTSPTIPKLRIVFNLTDEQTAWFGSLMPIGAILGGPSSGLLLNSVGRKWTVIASAIFAVIGYLCMGLIKTIWGLFLGRFFTGFSAGMGCSSIPVYVSEVSDANFRGRLGAVFEIFTFVGILIVYGFGMVLSNTWLALIGASLSMIPVLLMVLAPDTPRYWLIKNKQEKAIHVLKFLRGHHVDINAECREIKESLYASTNGASFLEYLAAPVIKPLFISVSLMFFQQFSGVNVMTFYTVEIFASAAPSIDPYLATIIMGVVQLVACIGAMAVVDRIGRKILLVVSAILMGVGTTLFGVYYQMTSFQVSNDSGDISAWNYSSHAQDEYTYLNILPLASMVVYFIGIAVGLSFVPWLMMSEIFPHKTRGMGSGITTAAMWVFAFTVTRTFIKTSIPDENKAVTSVFSLLIILGHLLLPVANNCSLRAEAVSLQGTFWMYAGVCFSAIVFVIFLVPETKGKSLEEIEKYFRDDSCLSAQRTYDEIHATDSYKEVRVITSSPV